MAGEMLVQEIRGWPAHLSTPDERKLHLDVTAPNGGRGGGLDIVWARISALGGLSG